MKLGLDIKATLSQTLTPQQIQYLKLLQLPVLQLEQQIRHEIELNPMLEDDDYDDAIEFEDSEPVVAEKETVDAYSIDKEFDAPDTNYYEEMNPRSMIDDDAEPFEFHKMLWDGAEESGGASSKADNDDDYEPFQIKDHTSFREELLQQLRLLPISTEEFMLGEHILGNIDDDGYLRRDLNEVVVDFNEFIEDYNYENIQKIKEGVYSEFSFKFTNGRGKIEVSTNLNNRDDYDLENEPVISNLPYNSTNGVIAKSQFDNGNRPLSNSELLAQAMARHQEEQMRLKNALDAQNNKNGNIFEEQKKREQKGKNGKYVNPAKKLALSDDSADLLYNVFKNNPELVDSKNETINRIIAAVDAKMSAFTPVGKVDIEDAERVLSIIRRLDPPGIGARSIQECLLEQLKSKQRLNPAERLAFEILDSFYDAFAKKHFHVITKELEVGDDYLREAVDVIKTLNPRPGGGDFQSQINTVIPDFNIENDEDTGDLIILVNDSRLPGLKLSKAYDNMKKEAKYKLYNKETREWIRNKFEDAKFLIQALRQRKNTMLKVMTAIAGRQRDFFDMGPAGLKPLIYKDISEDTGLDISTVCRIVNGKYVQTVFGTFELKFYFSESLPTDEGEEVSTRVIKQILKDIIEDENKKKPLSDDKLSKLLKAKGYNVARRTVAKYREQLKIPVARLRVEI